VASEEKSEPAPVAAARGGDAAVVRPRKRLPATVIALGFTSFLTDVGSEMIFPLLPVFVASLGAAPAFLGLVEGVADATSSLLKLVSGYLADRTAKKPMVIFGYATAAIVRPLAALATAPWHILAIRVTDRIGKGIRASPRDAMIAGSVEDHEAGRAFGYHRAMDHAGAVVGPLIATALLALGWEVRSVFWFALLPGVLSVLSLVVVREPPAAPRPAASHESDRPAPAARLPGSLRGYLAILALFSLGNSSDAFLLLRAREIGVSVTALPLLWTVFHVAKLISAYLGGDFADRVPRAKLIVSGWLVYALTYVGFGLATQGWQVWLLFIVYGSYYGLTEPAEKALVKQLAPALVQGRAYGFYNFIIGASAIPAGVLTGWLWQTWSPLVALSAGALIAGASSLALLAWNRAIPASAASPAR
jgi:MFS family permease